MCSNRWPMRVRQGLTGLPVTSGGNIPLTSSEPVPVVRKAKLTKAKPLEDCRPFTAYAAFSAPTGSCWHLIASEECAGYVFGSASEVSGLIIGAVPFSDTIPVCTQSGSLFQIIQFGHRCGFHEAGYGKYIGPRTSLDINGMARPLNIGCDLRPGANGTVMIGQRKAEPARPE